MAFKIKYDSITALNNNIRNKHIMSKAIKKASEKLRAPPLFTTVSSETLISTKEDIILSQKTRSEMNMHN